MGGVWPPPPPGVGAAAASSSHKPALLCVCVLGGQGNSFVCFCFFFFFFRFALWIAPGWGGGVRGGAVMPREKDWGDLWRRGSERGTGVAMGFVGRICVGKFGGFGRRGD